MVTDQVDERHGLDPLRIASPHLNRRGREIADTVTTTGVRGALVLAAIQRIRGADRPPTSVGFLFARNAADGSWPDVRAWLIREAVTASEEIVESRAVESGAC